MEYRYTAIILKKKDFNGTDRLYTFYTLEQGKVQAIARGIRKPHAKLAGQMENFSFVSLMIMRGRGLGNIKSALAEWTPKNIKESYEILQNIFLAVDRFDRMVDLEQTDKELFELLRNFLKLQDNCAKEHKQELSNLLTQAFLFQLISSLGYTFEVKKCVYCGNSISSEKPCVSYKQGGVVCDACKVQHQNIFVVSPELIKILRLISTHKLSSLQKLVVSQHHLRQIELFMRDYMRWTVE